MSSFVQRNVGSRIRRDYPTQTFLEKVWRLDTGHLPDHDNFTFPWPVRRLLARFDNETKRRLDIASGRPPSPLAVAAASAALESLETGTWALMANGVWQNVERFEENYGKWQRVMTLVEVRRSGQTQSSVNLDNMATTSTHHRRIQNDEAAFAQKLMFMLTSNVRYWVTGLAICDGIVTFWYADHMGVVVSAPFDCIRQPNLLYLAGLAMGSAQRSAFGFSSLMNFVRDGDVSRADWRTEMDFQDLQFVLPGAECGDDGEVDPIVVVGRSDEESPNVAPPQIVGRGTVVVPVRALDSVSIRRWGSEVTSVLKVAWASRTAPEEDRLVRKIRRDLGAVQPGWLAHITELRCSVTQTMDNAFLPRSVLFPEVPRDERVLRIQLLERCDSFIAVSSVRAFKRCFRDIVCAHHWVYVTSGILHRDISFDNIMVKVINGQWRGVLVDWDLAGPPSYPDSSVEFRRNGSVPFLAADFYAQWWYGQHQYRHDLEALFYLLTWYCACLMPAQRDINVARVATWYTDHELLNTADTKRHLYLNYATVMRHADPQYRALADSWVVRLSEYFREVNGEWYNRLTALHRELQRAPPDADVRETEVEFQELVRKREAAITFDGFMACISD